jgi:hypothetical protein
MGKESEGEFMKEPKPFVDYIPAKVVLRSGLKCQVI